MKKLFAFFMCAMMLICVIPIVSFAEAEATDAIVQETTVADDDIRTMTDQVLGYVQEHLEEISVIITLILTVLYQVLKHGSLNKSIGTLNNNAVKVAENSKVSIDEALGKMGNMSDAVIEYKEQIEKLLGEFRATAEEKQQLERALAETQKFIQTAKLANIEFANELAELLVLANIPPSKKEELYARHRKSVEAIADAEKTEVITNENGKETA